MSLPFRILLAFLPILSSCTRSGTKLEELNLTEVSFPNGAKILAETMVREMDITRGMMFRDSLARDRGMILVQSAEAARPAFTYNVRIPLDIVWMDKNLRVVEISANTPPCASRSARECPLYGGKEKSRYVLEVNAGVAAANGLKVGDRLSF